MFYNCGRMRGRAIRSRAWNEDAPLDITPILYRELLTATRKPGMWWSRSTLAGTLLIVILATFGARYYWDRGQVSDQDMMARVAFQAFLWMLAVQLGHGCRRGRAGVARDRAGERPPHA